MNYWLRGTAAEELLLAAAAIENRTARCIAAPWHTPVTPGYAILYHLFTNVYAFSPGIG